MTVFAHEELAPTVGDGKTVYRIMDKFFKVERQVLLRHRMEEDEWVHESTERYAVSWVSVDKVTGDIRQCKGILQPVHIKDILGKVEV